MNIAMIGLGKMGANMAARLLQGGHSVVAYDLNESSIRAAELLARDGCVWLHGCTHDEVD